MSSETSPLISKEEQCKKFQEEKSKIDILTRESNYPEAIEKYKELIKNIQDTVKKNYREEKEFFAKELLIPIYSNLCFIYIKQNDYNSIVQNANIILKIDKENIKALYRKCFAEINMYEFEKTEEDINKLRKLMPGSNELQKLENLLDEKKTEDNLKKMKKYKNMMRYYHKMNEENEYKNLSKIGKFFYHCKGYCRIIFCCCNKRKTIKKSY